MIIRTAQLREITMKLFDHLEEQQIVSIDIPQDYYWNISKKQKYDSYIEPSEFTVGQLTQDWHELEKLLDTKNMPLAYNFVWLASILRATGENIIS